jgi:hypothetical protein
MGKTYTVKKVAIFPSTSRLGTGKSLTFFYSVAFTCMAENFIKRGKGHIIFLFLFLIY